MNYHELITAEEYHGLSEEMLDTMPWLAQKLRQAVITAKNQQDFNYKQSYWPDPFIKYIRESFIPWILREHGLGTSNQVNDRLFYATALNLALLSPAIPEARLVLNELVESGGPLFRTASLLALAYSGICHPFLDQVRLDDALKAGIIFAIPLQLFRQILPQLSTVFLRNEAYIAVLVEGLRKRHNPFHGEYKRAEIALFITQLNLFVPEAIDECVSRPGYLRPDDALFMSYRDRGQHAVARLLGTNQAVLDHYVRLFDDAATLGDMEDLLNVLTYLERDSVTEHLVNVLLTLAMKVFEFMPLLYGIVVKTIIRLVNDGVSRYTIMNWLLARLEGNQTQIIRMTLDELRELEKTEDSLIQKVRHLASFEGDDLLARRIRTAASELVAKWSL